VLGFPTSQWLFRPRMSTAVHRGGCQIDCQTRRNECQVGCQADRAADRRDTNTRCDIHLRSAAIFNALKRESAAGSLRSQALAAVVAQEILGHGSIAMTANPYAHVGEQLKRQAADAMGAILAGENCLQVPGLQACLLGDARQHSRSDFVVILKGEGII